MIEKLNGDNSVVIPVTNLFKVFRSYDEMKGKIDERVSSLVEWRSDALKKKDDNDKNAYKWHIHQNVIPLYSVDRFKEIYNKKNKGCAEFVMNFNKAQTVMFIPKEKVDTEYDVIVPFDYRNGSMLIEIDDFDSLKIHGSLPITEPDGRHRRFVNISKLIKKYGTTNKILNAILIIILQHFPAMVEQYYFPAAEILTAPECCNTDKKVIHVIGNNHVYVFNNKVCVDIDALKDVGEMWSTTADGINVYRCNNYTSVNVGTSIDDRLILLPIEEFNKQYGDKYELRINGRSDDIGDIDKLTTKCYIFKLFSKSGQTKSYQTTPVRVWVPKTGKTVFVDVNPIFALEPGRERTLSTHFKEEVDVATNMSGYVFKGGRFLTFNSAFMEELKDMFIVQQLYLALASIDGIVLPTKQDEKEVVKENIAVKDDKGVIDKAIVALEELKKQKADIDNKISDLEKAIETIKRFI